MGLQDLASFKERFPGRGLGRKQVAGEVSKNLKAAGFDISRPRAEEVLNEVLRVIEAAVQAGKRVELRGFGTIHAHRRAVRKIFVPSKGKLQRVDARWIIRIETSKDLKTRLMQTLEG